MIPGTLESFLEVTPIEIMLYPLSEKDRHEHELLAGQGSCNPSTYGCDILCGVRNVFKGRWPSLN